MAVGNTRVSPGVYRDPSGKLIKGNAPVKKPVTQNPAQQPVATGSNPTGNVQTARNPNEFVRVSAGMYRDTKTGKLVRGQSPDKLASTWKADPTKQQKPTGNPDAGAVRVGSGQWRLADGRVVSSAGRPREGQFGATNTPTTEQTPAPTGQDNQVTPEMSDALKAFLFPTTDMANDPVHQMSLKRGEEALNRRLAAGGLMGSGREFELARDLTTDLETATQARYNEQRQENAGRLANLMEGQANRNLTQDQQEWNRIMDATRLMLEQNPANYGQNAMNSANQIQGDINSANRSNTASQYRTVTSGGGGVAPVRGPVDNSAMMDAFMNMLRAQGRAQDANSMAGLFNGLTTTGMNLFGQQKPKVE